MTTRTLFADLTQPQQAGILCNDPQFQSFVALRLGLTHIGAKTVNSSLAAEYLRDVCGIESRRELETNETAQTRLAALRTDFDAWRGRIAAQR